MTPQEKEGWHLNFLAGAVAEKTLVMSCHTLCAVFMHAGMQTCFDFTNKFFLTRRTSLQLTCVCVCVNTNYIVIVARCDIPTVVVLLLQIQVFLVVLMGGYLPVFRTVIWSKQCGLLDPEDDGTMSQLSRLVSSWLLFPSHWTTVAQIHWDANK